MRGPIILVAGPLKPESPVPEYRRCGYANRCVVQRRTFAELGVHDVADRLVFTIPEDPVHERVDMLYGARSRQGGVVRRSQRRRRRSVNAAQGLNKT